MIEIVSILSLEIKRLNAFGITDEFLKYRILATD